MLTDANKHFPRIKHNRPLESVDIARFIHDRSSFTVGDIIGILHHLHDAALFFMREGTPIRLEGLGIISSSIKLDGSIRITFRADKKLNAELNRENSLKKMSTHRGNIGKPLEEVKSRRSNRDF